MKVIIVSGPTACGKTNLSIDLARKFGGEIVNFDSLLLYKEIEVGTAKPSIEERQLVPHHMIDVRSISSPMNAADYAREAFPIVENILQKNIPVYLVGGSGFYLQALLKGMFNSPTTPEDILKRSEELYSQQGISPFVEILKLYDPESFERYHINDHYRIRRAVEHWWTTGFPLSNARKEKVDENLKLSEPSIHNWNILHLYLDFPKEDHLELIEKRTTKMIQDGLIDEVKSLLNTGYSGHEKPLQSIGYKETIDYLGGAYKDIETYKNQIVISTRQLAKSQRTWFKRDPSRHAYHPLEERSKIFLQVENFLKSPTDQE
jgi:tRNA dimethylallyltransferase